MIHVLLGLAVAAFILAGVFAIIAGWVFVKTDVKGAILFLQNKTVVSPQGNTNSRFRKGVALLNRTSNILSPSKPLPTAPPVVVQGNVMAHPGSGADTSENPTTLLDEETEHPTTLLDEEASENPTTLLAEESSEMPTSLLDQEVSENPTSLLMEDSENPTTLLDQEESERATSLLVEESENPTTLLDQDESERPTSLLTEEGSERPTALLSQENVVTENSHEKSSSEGKAEADSKDREEMREPFKFEIKQKDLYIHTDESI